MNPTETEEKQVERAVLVGLACHSFSEEQNADEETLAELAALTETAGGEPVAVTLQTRPAPDARTFIGEGKVEEVRLLAEGNHAELIIFDNELSPSQMRVLEELTQKTILDRSGLILDIFAQRARTGEGVGAISVYPAAACRTGACDEPFGRRHWHKRTRREQAGVGPPSHSPQD